MTDDRVPRLPVRFAGPVRAELATNAAAVLAILHEAIDDLRDAAAAAKAAGKLSIQVDALDRVARLALRYVELVTGKKVAVNMRIASQEDLPDWRALPRDAQDALGAALDAMEAAEPGWWMKELPAADVPDGGRSQS